MFYVGRGSSWEDRLYVGYKCGSAPKSIVNKEKNKIKLVFLLFLALHTTHVWVLQLEGAGI
jgi:hypothetical protein